MKRSLLPAVLGLLFASGAQAQSGQDVDELVRQWNALERQQTTVMSRWRERKSLLTLQLQLLQQERKTLDALVNAKKVATDEFDQRRSKLAAQQVSIESDQAALQEDLERTQIALKRLLPRLPPPLQDRWQRSYTQVLAKEDATASDRVQALVTMLTAANQFDQRITVHRTQMQNEAGETREVRQIYLGLGQAWFVSADSQLLGYGNSGSESWDWYPSAVVDKDLAQQLLNVLEMIEQPASTAPISLPVQLSP
ncbi:MAG: DUF3450 family protein [Pseudomonadota bacterium]